MALTCDDAVNPPPASENRLSWLSLIGGTFHAQVP
jgi:hypothetical protein